MSQLYQIDGKWLTIDQVHALKNKEEQERVNVVAPIEEVDFGEKEVTTIPVNPTIPTVEDVLSVDEKLPEKIVYSGALVKSELEKCTTRELRDIAKLEGITIKGQPSKSTLINLLIQK